MMNENPVDLFLTWYNQAKQADIDKPNAMTLSTVDGSGKAQSRIVLLSSFDENGFVFHTNYNSHKGEQLARNPSASLLFWWDQLGYQVRVTGEAGKTTESESDAYFRGRPRGSQIGAWASEQSHEISSRQVLEDRVVEFEKKFSGKDVARPPHWGGYRLVPERFEFWINRQNRLHDRILFIRSREGWQKKILAP